MQKRSFNQSRRHKIFYGSSYDRGLDILLYMWPDIREKYPNAELHICYGWDLFLQVHSNNPERMQWMESVETMMQQDGIVHHGRIGGAELQNVRESCGLWAYPTYFPEINCITALECQRDGVVPVTMKSFALKETVGSGILVDGDIKDKTVQEKYLRELLALMGNEKKWKEHSGKGREFAKDYDWEKIAKQWLPVFSEKISTPKVTVITPTIREGWWNLMAENLSHQTYKNFEWLIIDDHKEDRSHIADKYATEYKLDIRYIRNNKTRKYGICKANNTGWKEAKGELLVYLQDFIVIPGKGIESLVDIYRHNPEALIAPVDEHFEVTLPDFMNEEDWWNGETQVFEKSTWKNVRIQNKGIRKTENPFDFEMNYGAIPKAVLDKVEGWYEYFDDGIGYDNTVIAWKALQAGFPIIIDDTNKAMCVDHKLLVDDDSEGIDGADRAIVERYWKELYEG